MSSGEYVELARDIKAHGLAEPIWLYEGKILDGRHRYRACRESGIAPATRNYMGTDTMGFGLSMNLHRRHLNIEQKKKLVLDSAKENPTATTRTIAEKTGVSKSTVHRVMSQLGHKPNPERTEASGRRPPGVKPGGGPAALASMPDPTADEARAALHRLQEGYKSPPPFKGAKSIGALARELNTPASQEARLLIAQAMLAITGGFRACPRADRVEFLTFVKFATIAAQLELYQTERDVLYPKDEDEATPHETSSTSATSPTNQVSP